MSPHDHGGGSGQPRPKVVKKRAVPVRRSDGLDAPAAPAAKLPARKGASALEYGETVSFPAYGATHGVATVEAAPVDVIALQEELSAVKKRMESSEGQTQDLITTLQRLQAEFENARKRMAREREDLARTAAESILVKMLDVVDSFDRAVATAEKTDPKTFATGIRMIHRQFLDVLRSTGLKAIPAAGAQFDPLQHEAIEKVSRGGVEDNAVVEEVSRGYLLGTKVVRIARVIVNVVPAEAPPPVKKVKRLVKKKKREGGESSGEEDGGGDEEEGDSEGPSSKGTEDDERPPVVEAPKEKHQRRRIDGALTEIFKDEE